MNGGTSLEERIGRELERMRTEIGAERPVPARVLSRSRRAMVATVAATVLVAAVVATGSVAAWRALGPAASTPAGPAGGSSPGPTGVSGRGSVASTPAAIAALMARPLTLPTVTPGGACPTTPLITIAPGRGAGFSGSGPAQRAGHVYLAYTGRDVKLWAQDRSADGWYGIKDIWVVDGSHRGPVLIRGGRIDGSGPVELSFNPVLPRRDALVLDGGAPSLQRDPSSGWWSVPAVAFVRGPGCYAYQIDATSFTAHIVFVASR